MFWVLPIDYSLYDKTILGIFVYLQSYSDNKSKFSFTNSAVKAQHVLFVKEPFLHKILVSFLALIFFYTLKKSRGKII